MDQKEFTIRYKEFIHTGALSAVEQALIGEARSAASSAYAPYSGFRVGCALLLGNGRIIRGNNQENAAYPSGLCAERTALFYASATEPDTPVTALAITACRDDTFLNNPVAPCGSCRQVMVEYENRQKQPIRLILCGKKKTMVFDSARDLLPFAFDNQALRGGK